MFAEKANLAVLLLVQDEPPVAPWLLVIIAILLIILFIWLLLRERRARETAALDAAERMATSAEAAAVPDPATRLGGIEAPSVAAPTPEVEFRAAPVEIPVAPAIDDLEIIEGIGPKIASVLKAAGVTSFAQMAAMEAAQIDAILKEVPTLRLADPTSWPEQARLAANGDMAGLQALQDRLKGGR